MTTITTTGANGSSSGWSPYDLPAPLFLVWWIGHVMLTARRMERVIK